jgi:hypothetical protein
MRMGSDPAGSTPEVATSIRTRSVFDTMLWVEFVVTLPRFVVGFFIK